MLSTGSPDRRNESAACRNCAIAVELSGHHLCGQCGQGAGGELIGRRCLERRRENGNGFKEHYHVSVHLI